MDSKLLFQFLFSFSPIQFLEKITISHFHLLLSCAQKTLWFSSLHCDSQCIMEKIPWATDNDTTGKVPQLVFVPSWLDKMESTPPCSVGKRNPPCPFTLLEVAGSEPRSRCMWPEPFAPCSASWAPRLPWVPVKIRTASISQQVSVYTLLVRRRKRKTLQHGIIADQRRVSLRCLTWAFW